MKIRINDINASGLELEDSISLASLNKRMAEGKDNEIIFLKEPEVTLTVSGSERSAEAKGSIKTRYKQPCSRCLKEVEVDLQTEVNFMLRPESSRSAKYTKSSSFEEDENIIFFEGDYADIENILQETLILSLSPFLLPEKGQDGNCRICGVNYSEQFCQDKKRSCSMADLLKKAGVKSSN